MRMVVTGSCGDDGNGDNEDDTVAMVTVRGQHALRIAPESHR